MLVWAVVAASAVYWGLKLAARPALVPAQAVVAVGSAPQGDLTRLFGAAPAPAPEEAPVAAPANSRFQLLGVVAARGVAARSSGVALIAIDGKPPRAFRVGARVDGDNVLQSVAAREVAIGPRGGVALVSLQLPPPPPPATGVPQPAMGLPTAAPTPFANVPSPFQTPGAALPPQAPRTLPQSPPGFPRAGLPASPPAAAPANPNPFNTFTPPQPTK